ncbi:TIGR00159 family protein [candidate division WOR-1 bacterium RIFOXYD2_FULL_36_8]|uniref:Diadenylate cyclase n=1 Tax=candidate division WOR-1 bacterium RIFOXYB2_FULL_36_35 TaxID=1802578 RepID=A0A1F4S6S5_UNCSA|nr:MAG: TIGR00159 family protein [candidate division WOR-1 bacterium RIFOXYA2_FULL_36_21]OGC16141.1 MAG: TIGR00159 family protein [candidate division WOR-1 bacterium RIFOXYB2_FULL_36_35]OGC16942.1 MAG: TIGR00159 family protein [candidate division WOR-1 bacterium RIFOXYA12_FULL_36_13]OGC38708.1 MAG: TIGR00159 family protein [candidate division WOR-1 bacterium RIFOXYD2_FULL_36_8]
MHLRWILDLIDVLIVTVFLYYILLWLRGTRAANLIRGIIILLFAFATARILGLNTINWFFEKFAAAILVVLIIVFQPELRRALEQLGRGRFVTRLGFTPQPSSWFIRTLVRAIEQLSEEKTGGLIVLERSTGLNEYIESGTKIEGLLSQQLLTTIFNNKSALHDGAVIIHGDRILAAGSLLPLSESRLLDKRLGTRHRAAVGLSEITDAIVIVISEMNGTISIAENGYLTRFLTREMLEEKLFSLYREQYSKVDFTLPWRKKKK